LAEPIAAIACLKASAQKETADASQQEERVGMEAAEASIKVRTRGCDQNTTRISEFA
jgi:hypothetical protein